MVVLASLFRAHFNNLVLYFVLLWHTPSFGARVLRDTNLTRIFAQQPSKLCVQNFKGG